MLKKTITSIILYVLAFAAMRTLIVHYVGIWYKHYAFWYFVGSLAGGSIIFKRYLRSGSFYGTLRHELCHWFFALLSFNKPHSLNINGDGSGQYAYSGRRNYCIALAPYFFPLVTVLLLLLQVFFVKPAIPYFILLGIALAFDLSSMKNDYHLQQTDWQQYGVLFSIQFSLLVLLLFMGTIGIVLFGGFGTYPNFLKAMYHYMHSFF